MTLVQKFARDGEFSRLYNFDSVDSTNTCKEGSKCEGYSLQGNYQVSTNPEGESYLEVNTHVTSGSDYKERSMFGVGWGIGFGQGETKATESYLALWSWQQSLQEHGWGNISGVTNMPIEQVVKDPLKA